MESDCEFQTGNIPLKAFYTCREQVLEELLKIIPEAFFMEFQFNCLFKKISDTIPKQSNEELFNYNHRIYIEMNKVKTEMNDTIQEMGHLSMMNEDNVSFGIHWTSNWLNGVAKKFVYCILSAFYKNGVNSLVELKEGDSHKRQLLSKHALKEFDNFLRRHHVNKWKDSLLSLSSVVDQSKTNNEQKRKFLSTATIERYIYQATDFFVILGCLPVTYVNECHRPLHFYNLGKRQLKSNTISSPKGVTKVVVGAILKNDIYRYINKCIEMDKTSIHSIFLPRTKKDNQFSNSDNSFWVKLDDFYKWLILVFVQATALKSQTIVGTSDDATGALKVGDLSFLNGPHGSFKLVVRISRLQTVQGGESVVLLSSAERYCPVKMMMTWLAVRNVFKLPFSECLNTGNFEIKSECQSEWLFPQSDQNGGIKTKIWSCNVISNAVDDFAKTMKIQKVTVGSRSLRKGHVVELFCSLIRGGFTGARKKLLIHLNNLPGWDNDKCYSQLRTPLYNDRTLCQGYDQLIINAKNNGTLPPDPIDQVPSLIDVANALIPEGFDKSDDYHKLFDSYYEQTFNNNSIVQMNNEIDFLKVKENESPNPYTAKRLQILQKAVNYRMSPTHKSDQKIKFRQRWLFAKYKKAKTVTPNNDNYKPKSESLDLKAIANFAPNFAEHCVGEVQGLSQEICAYGLFKCPIKGCDEKQVNVDHVASHRELECSLCDKDKQYGNLKAFKKHFTDYHIPTYYCISCGNLCSESPPHKKECKDSIAVNRKYIRLFFSPTNKVLDCSCFTEECLQRHPAVLKALHFPSLNAVANVCYTEADDLMFSTKTVFYCLCFVYKSLLFYKKSSIAAVDSAEIF